MTDKPLRVLHVGALKGWGGGQAQILCLAQGLRERGHEVLVACRPGGELQRRAGEAGIQCAPLPMRHSLDAGAVFRLAATARRFSPHVMHLHTAVAHSVGCAAGRLARVPVVVAHKRTDYAPGRALLRLRWEVLIDAAIAVSAQAKRSLVEAGVCADRVRVIHSAVDCQHFRPGASDDSDAPRVELGLPEDVALVGAVGALEPHKGYHVLLEAMRLIVKEFPRAQAVLCGAGSAARELKRLAGEPGAAPAIFVGELRDVRPLLASIDVFAHPALREALGVAVLEAMAMGRAIVASRAGGIPEAVQDGRSALLVAPGDADALARAMANALRDADLRRRLGAAARARAEALFSSERMVQHTEDLYYELLGAA